MSERMSLFEVHEAFKRRDLLANYGKIDGSFKNHWLTANPLYLGYYARSLERELADALELLRAA